MYREGVQEEGREGVREVGSTGGSSLGLWFIYMHREGAHGHTHLYPWAHASVELFT